MTEHREHIVSAYTAMDQRKQEIALTLLVDHLTLMARDTYDTHGGVADAIRLRAFNEAQNRIAGQLHRLIAGTKDDIPMTSLPTSY
jgi:hypothetical protein